METGPHEADDEFEEPERLMAAEGNPTQEELTSEAEEKRDSLKAELIRVKQKLADLSSDSEALPQQQKMEIEAKSRTYCEENHRPYTHKPNTYLNPGLAWTS